MDSPPLKPKFHLPYVRSRSFGTVLVSVSIGMALLWLVLHKVTQVQSILGCLGPNGELYYVRQSPSGDVLVERSGTRRTPSVLGRVKVTLQPSQVFADKLIGSELLSDRYQLCWIERQLRSTRPMFRSTYSDMSPVCDSNCSQVAFIRAARSYTSGWGSLEWTDWDLYLAKPDGSDLRRLTKLTAKEMTYCPIGPGFDRFLLGWRIPYGQYEIGVFSLASGQVKRISPESPNSYGCAEPTSSADGTVVVFRSDRAVPGAYELWRMDVDGAHPRQITKLGRRCSQPIVLRDGKTIVFLVDEVELWQVSMDGSELTRIE